MSGELRCPWGDENEIFEQFSKSDLENGFADFLANSSQSGAHTGIDMGGGDSITLVNVSRAAMHQDDFIFWRTPQPSAELLVRIAPLPRSLR